MSESVEVRGRDFIKYRIAGAIASFLLLIALAWQVFELFDGDARTIPEVRWGVAVSDGERAGPADEGSSILAVERLTARTKLQDERYRTGPAPDQPAPGGALSRDDFMINTPMGEDEGRSLSESWGQYSSQTGALIRRSERVSGISSLPYANAELFERPFARDWRLGIADIATHLGALSIIGFSLLLALILAIRGRVPIAKGRSGHTVKRFNFFERATHWMTATSFLGLAVTGLVIAFGDTLIRPFGENVLGAAGWISTWGHAMFFPSFALGVVLMALMWTWRNLPSRLDINWLVKGGGFFSDGGDNPPARKFNAGQKLIFWSVMLGGGLMVLTGVTLMFPFYWLDLQGMSWAMLIHAIVGALLITIFIGHIYIGTVGMEGAFWAMWGGDVDRNWAEEHHELWLTELEASSASHKADRRA